MNKILSFILIVIFLFFPYCASLNRDISPHNASVYHSLMIKVKAKNMNSKQRQNFKILLKYDNQKDKILFLSPINQVYGTLTIENEKSLLVNSKKKKYWIGYFNHILLYFWELDLTYQEFKELIINGKIPKNKIKDQDVQISLSYNENQYTKKSPQIMKIATGNFFLVIKISNHKTKKGRISFSRDLNHMTKCSIKELLEN